MLKSGHSEAAYRYAHHMGSGEAIPAMAWAEFREGGKSGARIELSGLEFPELNGAELEAKAVAILRAKTKPKLDIKR